MPITLEQVRRFLGRTLQDPYGRAFGKVVGISANLRDEITGVGIEEGNGEFLQCPGDRVTISGDTLILAPAWKVEAEEFRKEFDIVTRRLRALDELFSVGDIQKDVYEDLRKQHEDAINELKGKRKEIIDTLSQRTSTLNTQLRQLQTHLAGNKMLHASGEFDDMNYKAASDAIDSGLVRAMAEKKDVETIYSYLQKLDATQTPPAAQQPQPIPQAAPPTQVTTSPSRDPVLVLHVRET
jgi:CdvA-like coiled-coil domain